MLKRIKGHLIRALGNICNMNLRQFKHKVIKNVKKASNKPKTFVNFKNNNPTQFFNRQLIPIKQTERIMDLQADSTKQNCPINWHFRHILITIWKQTLSFGEHTTIHGLNRLLGANSTQIERLVWLITFTAAFLGTINVCLLLSKRYNESKFQTVVDSTRYPVYRIYFPVVTICNRNRLNWQRLEEAKQRFLPGENSTEKLRIFERVISAYDNISIENFEEFSGLSNESLAGLNHVNFSSVFEFMTWRCEEILTNCLWRHFTMNCCDIFSLRRCLQGLCLAFNTLENEEGRRLQQTDPYWPWRTGSSGPQSGLQVRVLINPEKHYPLSKNKKGINVMITEPTVWHRESFIIASYTRTVIEVEPVIFFYDNDTRNLPSEQRQCVFQDETESNNFKSLHGYGYMKDNCMSQCQQEYLLRYCNCTMDLFFPPAQYPFCKTVDLLCLGKNRNNFIYSEEPGEQYFVYNHFKGMNCECFRNCFSLNYILNMRETYLPSTIHGNVSYVDLDVYYRSETMLVYRTSLIFDWVDLIVSFGGIAGLFLGCSLISGIELAYFFCLEIPFFTINGLKENWLRKRTIPQAITVNQSRNRFDVQNQLKTKYVLQIK